MNESTIQQLLDDLARAQDAYTAITLAKEEAQDSVLTDEIRQQLDDIAAEYEPQESAALVAIGELQDRVKAAVIEHGATVKHPILQAVYSGGRVNYDAKALDGLLLAMPELAAFRKESAPSVSIRASVKKG